jgi:choline monooxygenase
MTNLPAESQTSKVISPQTLPASLYREAAHWPLERESLFAQQWLFFGHESDLCGRRTFRVDNLAGFSIIVLRDDNDHLQAYHNVCRHRAGPLVRESQGICDSHLQCPYHGWTYTLDGRLRAARDFGAADGFDPRDYGLFRVSIKLWNGLIFIHMGETHQDLDQALRPISDRLNKKDWSVLKVGTRRSHLIKCNWKTYVENYLEGYHIPTIHPGLDSSLDTKSYRVLVEDKIALHDAPPSDPGALIDGVWAWFYPNLAFNIYADSVMIERMSPIGHDQTQLDYVYLTIDGYEPPQETIKLSNEITAEDIWIVERVQQNLDAGVYETGRLSPKHEMAVARFQDLVRQSLKI